MFFPNIFFIQNNHSFQNFPFFGINVKKKQNGRQKMGPEFWKMENGKLEKPNPKKNSIFS